MTRKFLDLYEAVPAKTTAKAGQKTTTPAKATPSKKKKSTAVQKAGFRLKKAGAYCYPIEEGVTLTKLGKYNTVEACFNACKAKARSQGKTCEKFKM